MQEDVDGGESANAEATRILTLHRTITRGERQTTTDDRRTA